MFFVDFTEGYSLWERVIKGFINKFREENDHLLVLYIDKKFARDNSQLINLLYDFINKVLIDKNAKCSIDVCIDRRNNERAIFKKVDYLITNRSKETIRHSEYAYENSIKIISGVDVPIF